MGGVSAAGPAPGLERAVVGIGANLGDAMGTVLAAIEALRTLAEPPGALRASSLWLTAPVDATGPDFVNAVACFDTALAPAPLLRALQAIEQRFGRERPYRNAPRTLDLDLLLLGDRTSDDPFVLLPQALLPGHGPAVECWDRVRTQADQRVRRLQGPYNGGLTP